ncbi:MAG: 30S ribosomal protein S12 methylthiotransferase RimO [Armatimonadota bacterium]
MANICVVSLGCPKNLVDAEGACGEIAFAGYKLVSDLSEADVIIVNTCAFIESARQESVEVIEQAIEYKQAGRCQAVIVTGCLVQRYGANLMKAEPRIDGALGIYHAGIIADCIHSVLDGKRVVGATDNKQNWTEHKCRLRCTPPWIAYVKVCDGCDNRCSYCTIPTIRGGFRSRPKKLIVDEVKKFADEGVKEIILVGQDTTQYGTDLYGRPVLLDLLEELGDIEPLRWIRVMYCYPTKISNELIELVSKHDKIVKYLDIPFQHGDDRILAAMNRQGSTQEYMKLVEKIRESCPEITLRSSFITGFPGESDQAFRNLYKFIERIQLDRVGVFEYSREEGTQAYHMKPKIPPRITNERREILMLLQQQISMNRNQRFVGKMLDVLVEQKTEDGAVGRSYRDAPEIDGLVYVNSTKVEPGEFVRVKISEADEYDLRGTPVSSTFAHANNQAITMEDSIG